jgi:hypothetical protein
MSEEPKAHSTLHQKTEATYYSYYSTLHVCISCMYLFL